MKRLKLLSSIMVFFMALGLTSCDVEPVDPNLIGENPVDNTPASFEVFFSNDTYRATTTAAVVANGFITITATQTGAGTFTITVPAATGAAAAPMITYTPSASMVGMYTNMSLTGISGSVNITSFNTTTNKVTGTFNFTGYWSDPAANLPNIVFSNGIFTNIAYTGDGVTEPVGDPLFEVKIDGVLYTASTYEASVGGGLIDIGGFRGTNGEYVAIAIEGLTEGVYTDEAIFSYSPDGDEDNTYSNISLTGGDDTGTVEITEIDEVNRTISGTFSFTGYLDGAADKSFTEGKFENIPYTVVGEEPSDDLFNATVDGTLYVYGGTDLIISTVNDNQITMQAINANHEVRIFAGETATEGNYPFSTEFGSPAKAWFVDADDNEYTITNGTLTITSRTATRIAGTFTYDVLDGTGGIIHTVTNGEFDVEYN